MLNAALISDKATRPLRLKNQATVAPIVFSDLTSVTYLRTWRKNLQPACARVRSKADRGSNYAALLFFCTIAIRISAKAATRSMNR